MCVIFIVFPWTDGTFWLVSCGYIIISGGGKKKGPTEIWTWILGFKVPGANRYTIGPSIKYSINFLSGTEKNDRPYIWNASAEQKSLVIYTHKFLYTHACSYLVFLWLPTPSRWPKIVVKVENWRVGKTGKIFIICILLLFSRQIIFLFSISAIYKKYSYHSRKKTMETRIIINISNKMKDVKMMSKPKKHANKIRWDSKLNKPLPYNPT